MITDRIRRLVTERDQHCLHCGTTEGLQVHHRKNRGQGGSKVLDRLDNLILVCAAYNYAMEADPDAARDARDFGHKLQSWQDFSNPVFDRIGLTWYKLTKDGRKEKVNAPDYLI